MGNSKRPIWPWIAGLFLIALIASPMIIEFSLIPTGWNTDSNLDRVYVENDRFDLNYRGSEGHVYSKEAVIDLDSSYWDSRVWTDAARYMGTTTIKITLNNPTEVWLNPSSRDWEPISNPDVPFDYYTKTVNGIDYTYEHRVFEVDIQVITMGEVTTYRGNYYGTCDGLPGSGTTWFHTDDTNEAVPANMDHNADFEIRTAFNLNPWSIKVGDTLEDASTEDNDDYWLVEDQFMGVMSASIIAVHQGDAAGAPSDPTFGGHTQPTQQAGAALSLFNFDDSAATSYYQQLNTQGSEALGSIKNIPMGLMFAVSGSIEPGLKVQYGWFGIWDSATPVQKFITWRVRVDVLTALGVRLISGAQPTITPTPTIDQPEPDKPGFFDWLWDGLGAMGDWFSNPLNIIVAAVVLIIVIIAVAFILGKSIPFILPGRKKVSVSSKEG